MGRNVPAKRGSKVGVRRSAQQRDRRVAYVQIRTRREERHVKRVMREMAR